MRTNKIVARVGFVALLANVSILSGCRDDGATVPLTAPAIRQLEDGSPLKAVPGMVVTDESRPRPLAGAVAGTPALAVGGAPPVWEPNFGTGLNQFDDDCDFRSFGFSFTFYGVAYSGVWINSNGNLTFNRCNNDWWHPDIPDGSNVIIAALYGDFNPAVAGDVYFNTLGTAPNRRFVVTWSNVPEFFPSNTGHSTFQVQLYEASGAILFAYNGLGTDGINWSYSAPSTDPNMDVGISSGTGLFINSASGTAIPGLDMMNLCYLPMEGGYTDLRGPCVIPVDVDVKPGSDPNSINTRSKGVVPVAILGSDEFDVTDIDVTTLQFGPAAASPAHDLTRKGTYHGHLQDVNSDGYLDLVSHYRHRQTGLSKGVTEACITAATTSGIPVEGCDAVRIVK